MNKHGGMIEIKGFRGICIFLFLVCCFLTGFCLFPGFFVMHAWNFAGNYIEELPQMNVLHGSMLWLALFLIGCVISGKKIGIGFACIDEGEDIVNSKIINELKSEIAKENETHDEKENK